MFNNKVVHSRLVVVLITLSDWFLLHSLFVPCCRQHKSNDANAPILSKNDVLCASLDYRRLQGKNTGCREGMQSNLWGVRIKIQFINYLNAFRRTGIVAATERTRKKQLCNFSVNVCTNRQKTLDGQTAVVVTCLSITIAFLVLRHWSSSFYGSEAQ